MKIEVKREELSFQSTSKSNDANQLNFFYESEWLKDPKVMFRSCTLRRLLLKTFARKQLDLLQHYEVLSYLSPGIHYSS